VTTYRDDRDALRARVDELESELREREAELEARQADIVAAAEARAERDRLETRVARLLEQLRRLGSVDADLQAPSREPAVHVTARAKPPKWATFLSYVVYIVWPLIVGAFFGSWVFFVLSSIVAQFLTLRPGAEDEFVMGGGALGAGLGAIASLAVVLRMAWATRKR
jgi:hypothetical protein